MCLKAVEAKDERARQYVLAANRCKSGFEKDDFECITQRKCLYQGWQVFRGSILTLS